jgi:arylsulfatase A-like enzyme
LAARWPGRIKPGRVIEDCVNLMDLGPTFMEAAGESPPDTMTARSLMPVLESEKSGQVEADRTFVVTGRERHVANAREGHLPYPQRAIRTRDFLYIINFAPDRWPVGDPKGLDDPGTEPPSYEELSGNTFIAYADLDASPTKAWMIHHRAEEAVQQLFEIGFGKRPREELYDLRVDPHHMNNVAGDPAYEQARAQLAEKLMRVLREQDDPRVVEEPCRYEHAPYAGPVRKK